MHNHHNFPPSPISFLTKLQLWLQNRSKGDGKRGSGVGSSSRSLGSLTSRAASSAFTIVELLIVIVVIGILAAIIAVAFNGITRDAAVAALQADLKQAATTLELHKIDNSTYPTSEEAALALISASAGATFQYTFTPPNSFCLSIINTTTDNIPGFHITGTSSDPTEGVCEGHEGPDAPSASGTPMVAAGTGHTLALDSDGQVYAWGDNTYGHLGNGTTNSSLVPIPITGGDLAGKTVSEVAAAANHSLALDSDGQVYAWGRNSYGRLGDGTTTDRHSPVAITGGALSGKTIVAIEAGSSHSLALDSDGQVYAWGRNLYGQIGDGTSTDRHSPVAITGGTLAGKTITKIAAAGELSFAIDTSGMLHGWGRNYYGALGVSGAGTGNTPNPTPGAVDGSAGLAGKTVSSVATSSSIMASFAVDSTGVLYAWGNGSYNSQLGTGVNGHVGSPTPVTVGDLAGKVIAMASAGGGHSLALDSTGAVYAWGSNDFGELGIAGGKVGTAKHVNTGDLTGKTVIFISAGHSFSVAITNEGQVVAWGRNYAGQLGDGTTTDRNTPTAISGLDLN